MSTDERIVVNERRKYVRTMKARYAKASRGPPVPGALVVGAGDRLRVCLFQCSASVHGRSWNRTPGKHRLAASKLGSLGKAQTAQATEGRPSIARRVRDGLHRVGLLRGGLDGRCERENQCDRHVVEVRRATQRSRSAPRH